MGDDGDCRDDAQLVVGEKRGGDQNPVHEIVESVADHDHHAAAAVIVMQCDRGIVRFALLDVAMAPQHQFFQHEEQQYAGKYGGGETLDAVGHAEGVGKNLQEHRAEQRTHRVAHQDRYPGRARVERHGRSRNDREHAAGHGRRQYPHEGHLIPGIRLNEARIIRDLTASNREGVNSES
ncbi:hypothetical protein D3C83_17430 [compost metagenome]